MNNYGRKNISEETISEALQKVKIGYSYSLVAAEYGVSKSLIGKWVKKAGVKPNTTLRKGSSYDRSKVHTSQDWSQVKLYSQQELATHQKELLAKVREAIELIPETFEVENDGELIEVKKGVGDFKKEVLNQLTTLEKETL